MFEDLKTRLVQLFVETPIQLGLIHERISGLTNVLYRHLEKKQPELPPFVCIVAFCEMLDRSKQQSECYGEPRFGFYDSETKKRYVPTTLGVSGYMKYDQESFYLDPHVELRKIQIVVFCDLERVVVQSFKVGNENLSASGVSTNPVAYYDGVMMPGSRIEIQCARRVSF